MLYACVRILNAPYAIDKSYSYHIPFQMQSVVKPGAVVVVPFGGGNSTKNAVVESISDTSSYEKTKPILGVPGSYLYVKPELLELCGFMSDRLFCSVGDAVKCVLPSGLGVRSVSFYSPSEDKPDAAEEKLNPAARSMYEFICREGRVSITELKKQYGSTAVSGVKNLIALKLCEKKQDFECFSNTKDEQYAVLCRKTDNPEEDVTAGVSLTPKQKSVAEALSQYDSPCPVSELMRETDAGISVLKELAKKGVLRLFKANLDRSEINSLTSFDTAEYGDFTLSDEQEGAYNELFKLYKNSEPKAALLWGVTGSGKTNVILKLIDKVLEDGKNVIVLVPEIALTSQTLGRFSARYEKSGIVMIHSALSEGERTDAWKKITDGGARIVIGTRSAVFAPLDNIGLIVMDEEHDGSFKSDKSPKYHARDIAKFRCVYNKALLVMASATPAVESFYNAKIGKYSLIQLKSRYGDSGLPEVEFADMKNEPYFVAPDDAFDSSADEKAQKMTEYDFSSEQLSVKSPEESEIPLVIGQTLRKELEECLEEDKQAILFINRRGYRAFALCRSCGYVFTCPNCSVSLTHHKMPRGKKSVMTCHYCGYTCDVPTVCPNCSKSRISFVGSGTQLVEEMLAKEFPKARVLRMDADTTSKKYSHEKILSSFRNGEADILVGTQMVAKGHDFPGVSLVGIANADISLFINDFRANEKTFSLLTQVLGRAGRAKGVSGKAVIQTYVPDNEVLNLAASQDYEKFYELEIAFRKANVFPPFCDIVTAGFSSEVETDVINAVRNFKESLDTAAKNDFSDVKFILFGPFRNEIYRLAGKYRMRFIIKCRATPRFRAMLSHIFKEFASSVKDVAFSADINPTNL